MRTMLAELIQIYENRLKEGQIFLLDHARDSEKYKIQTHINRVWKIVLMDLRIYSDKFKHENEN